MCGCSARGPGSAVRSATWLSRSLFANRSWLVCGLWVEAPWILRTLHSDLQEEVAAGLALRGRHRNPALVVGRQDCAVVGHSWVATGTTDRDHGLAVEAQRVRSDVQMSVGFPLIAVEQVSRGASVVAVVPKHQPDLRPPRQRRCTQPHRADSVQSTLQRLSIRGRQEHRRFRTSLASLCNERLWNLGSRRPGHTYMQCFVCLLRKRWRSSCTPGHRRERTRTS